MISFHSAIESLSSFIVVSPLMCDTFSHPPFLVFFLFSLLSVRSLHLVSLSECFPGEFWTGSSSRQFLCWWPPLEKQGHSGPNCRNIHRAHLCTSVKANSIAKRAIYLNVTTGFKWGCRNIDWKMIKQFLNILLLFFYNFVYLINSFIT